MFRESTGPLIVDSASTEASTEEREGPNEPVREISCRGRIQPAWGKEASQRPTFHIFGNVRDITQTTGKKSPMSDGTNAMGVPKFKSL